ncbi:MAG: aromatic-ring-hydroxylating dioxygenase subunit beta [Gammaproteobacteria bacterium]
MDADTALLREIETLLYDEADCLDRADLDAWMQLYTEDGSYWMPAAPGQEDPLNHISHFYDDRVMMEIRKRNFVHPRAASKDHPVRCSHLIGNIRLLSRDAEGILVRSNFHAMLFYREETRLFGGRYEHALQRQPEGLRIRRKRVDLIDCDAPHKSIVIYL